MGRALLEAAIGMARAREADAIYTWRDLNEEISERFLGPAGFKRYGRDLFFEANIERPIEVYRPLMDQLRARGKIPPEARLIPYREADPFHTARLNEAGVSLIPPGHYACTSATNKDANNRYRCSQALLVKDRLAGLTVVRFDGDAGNFETWVVNPSFHGTWANALLLAHTLSLMKREGVRIVRFYCNEDNLNMVRIAQRVDARLVKQGVGYRLAL